MTNTYIMECSICGDKGDGLHFGAFSCKACAAFFRRAVSQKLNHFCKIGNNQCKIDKSIISRFWCASCRFVKCQFHGMDSSHVQPKRGKISQQSEEALKKKALRILLKKAVVLEKTCLLPTLVTNYRYLCKSRRNCEWNLPNLHNNHVIGSGKMKGCRLASITEMNQAFQVGIPCIIEFVNSTFPDFSKFSTNEKDPLIERFLIRWAAMDNSYCTYRKVPKEKFHTMSIMSETFYFDTRKIDALIIDCSVTIQKEDLKKQIELTLGKRKNRIVNLMSEIEIQEEEYVSILGLIFWSPKIDVTTPKIDEIGSKYRAQIFQELHNFYKENPKNYDFAQRFGELSVFLTVVLEEVIGFREDLELFALLDAFGKELSYYNLIRNSTL